MEVKSSELSRISYEDSNVKSYVRFSCRRVSDATIVGELSYNAGCIDNKFYDEGVKKKLEILVRIVGIECTLHRLVNTALAEEMKQIHALSLKKGLTPAQYFMLTRILLQFENYSVMAKSFEDFEPILGEAKAEWTNPIAPPMLPFLFHFHALDSSRLRIHVTDFHSYTWEAIRSIHQLEDLRGNIGMGGSWSEFVDYLIASVKSDNVKLVVEGHSKLAGATFAKLISHKSKGMPLISIPLDRLKDSSANDAMSNLSLELFKAFRSKHNLAVKEQERSYHLTKFLYAEQEKNETIKNQLDAILFSKRQKSRNLNSSDKAYSSTLTSLDTISVSEASDSPDKPSTKDSLSTKVGRHVVPAYRRVNVRGVVLQDTEGQMQLHGNLDLARREAEALIKLEIENAAHMLCCKTIMLRGVDGMMLAE
ncbi:hypothetical protein HHK36_004276 [Tetracentron sinense]|uniref:Uncharacterized protein n=1 Tax=Tetracentron sinense TaxID=13715 RepID=A0A835DPB6_TETSI|nr:hypothetical protein HHK36_004276 [Tetracentron sinense]